jgi:hypothetical protein
MHDMSSYGIAAILLLSAAMSIHTTQALDQKDPAAVSQTPSQQNAPAGAENKAVVEMTIRELRRFDPEISYLKFNPSQDKLADLLKKVGDRVVAFFRDFSNTSSREKVDLARSKKIPALDADSMWRRTLGESRVEEFNYLILPGSGKAGISWVEDRADKKNRPLTQKAIQGFIMSSGYASLCMYLHPSHQENSRFRYLGRDKRKPRDHVIAFTQKPEAEDYLAQYSEISSPLPIRYLVQGFVWVNPDNFQITRMRTSMLMAEKQATLKKTSTDVRYGRVQFGKSKGEFWLPKRVDISWEFPDWIYRNRHQYSDYHLFTVESDFKIAQPKAER